MGSRKEIGQAYASLVGDDAIDAYNTVLQRSFVTFFSCCQFIDNEYRHLFDSTHILQITNNRSSSSPNRGINFAERKLLETFADNQVPFLLFLFTLLIFSDFQFTTHHHSAITMNLITQQSPSPSYFSNTNHHQFTHSTTTTVEQLLESPSPSGLSLSILSLSLSQRVSFSAIHGRT